MFIGTGADILEFVSETIEDDTEKASKCDPVLRYMIWSVWTWSLLQFTLVLTASTAKKRNIATTSAQTHEEFKASAERNGLIKYTGSMSRRVDYPFVN